jgi:hypothetical protein
MVKPGYNMSFTSGGLFFNESLRVAEVFLEKKDWKMVRDTVLENNIIQTRTEKSLKTITGEIITRLKLLTGNQLKLLISGYKHEQNFLLWLAICKKHEFIKDFAVEVMREKYLKFDYELTPQDYDIFYNRKSDWHPELEKFTETTKDKLRQVLFRIIREVEIVTGENTIVPVLFTEDLAKVIIEDNASWFNIYPISDLDIGQWIKK